MISGALWQAIAAALLVGGLILTAIQPALAKESVKPIVTIRVIPHEQQRYPTVGDWHFDRQGNLKISVTK